MLERSWCAASPAAGESTRPLGALPPALLLLLALRATFEEAEEERENSEDRVLVLRDMLLWLLLLLPLPLSPRRAVRLPLPVLASRSLLSLSLGFTTRVAMSLKGMSSLSMRPSTNSN